jgi:Fe-S-cluster containining protein
MTSEVDVRVHLETPGWAITAGLAVPREPASLEVWLPFLQAIASQIAAKARAASDASGRPVSCSNGCGGCCRQPVSISLIEARALANLVAQMPEPRRQEVRRRFAEGQARLAQSGVLAGDHSAPAPEFPLATTASQRLIAAWFALQIVCPFLEDESCSIYEDRPLICREHMVTTPASACSRPFREAVDWIELRVRIADALVRATAKLAGLPAVTVPLMTSLSLEAGAAASLSRPHDPREMLEVLLGEIGEWRIEPAS